MKPILIALISAVFVIAADEAPKPAPTPESVPVIDANLRIALLARQVKLNAADRAVEQVTAERDKLRAAIAPDLAKAVEECKGGEPKLTDTDVVCGPKPAGPVAPGVAPAPVAPPVIKPAKK